MRGMHGRRSTTRAKTKKAMVCSLFCFSFFFLLTFSSDFSSYLLDRYDENDDGEELEDEEEDDLERRRKLLGTLGTEKKRPSPSPSAPLPRKRSRVESSSLAQAISSELLFGPPPEARCLYDPFIFRTAEPRLFVLWWRLFVNPIFRLILAASSFTIILTIPAPDLSDLSDLNHLEREVVNISSQRELEFTIPLPEGLTLLHHSPLVDKITYHRRFFGFSCPLKVISREDPEREV